MCCATIVTPLLIALTIVAGVQADQPALRLCEPWKSDYVGDDATGQHVIALWKLDGEKIEDASGHGHTGTLHGGTISPAGRFGSCLETFRGLPVEDKEHRALIENRPDLSPQGPFTLELWIKPKPELNSDYPQAFLLDKKYVAHADYQMIVGPPDSQGARILRVSLGFGAASDAWYAKPATFRPGTWSHVAFTYDGKGEGSFYLNGHPWGAKRIEGRQSIAAGTHPLSIGDRIGSGYGGFPGFIDQVRLSSGVLEFRPARIEQICDRACFVRRESPVLVRFEVTNLQHRAAGRRGSQHFFGRHRRENHKARCIAPGKPVAVDYPLDTSLRPDAYRLVARLNTAGSEPYQTQEAFPVRIAPRQPPHRFPVLMWGIWDPQEVSKEMGRLKQIGFNHVLGLGADNRKIWETGKPTTAADAETVAQTKRLLDGVGQRHDRRGRPLASFHVDRPAQSSNAWIARVSPTRRAGSAGRLRADAKDRGVLLQRRGFGRPDLWPFPAFGAALLHTEVRDNVEPVFHKHDFEAFRKASGSNIPAGNRLPMALTTMRVPGFPADHVIPDNQPLYVFYRWFWKAGDGWNGLNTALHRGLKSTGRRDLWTFHDPAVRVPCVYGSGGEATSLAVDLFVSDPLNLAVATDELLAMAGGAAGKQDAMKMTQIIWYRSQTAPIPKKPADAPAYQARWEQEQPAAEFITIAPMHLREAFWNKIARPIRGIMYHGWESLVPTEALGRLLFHASRHATRIGPADPRGRPAARSHPSADARGEKRRGLFGELCLGNVRRSHHVQLRRLEPLLAGRRVSGPTLCPPATGDRF